MEKPPRIVTALVFTLALSLGCTAAQWQRTKAHAVEGTVAGTGGAIAVLVAWPLGPIVGFTLIIGSGVIGETLRPPDPVTVVSTDKDGKTTVRTYQPKKTGDPPPQDSSWLGSIVASFLGALRWVLVVLFLIWGAKMLTKRYRGHWLAGAWAFATGHWKTAGARLKAAGGMKHTSDVP